MRFCNNLFTRYRVRHEVTRRASYFKSNHLPNTYRYAIFEIVWARSGLFGINIGSQLCFGFGNFLFDHLSDRRDSSHNQFGHPRHRLYFAQNGIG